MPTTTFDTSEQGPSTAQQEAEAQALAQGEKLAEAAAADRARKFDELQQTNEDVSLIGGKFKSQEELLKAYQALEQKMGRGESTEEGEEPTEEPVAASDEAVEEEAPSALLRASKEYDETGVISEEAIDELSKMDSKELIKTYVDYYTKNVQQAQQAQEVAVKEQAEIKQIAGGEEGYNEMIRWAAENLEPQEIDAFNNVTNSGNVTAIKFAVEALNGRFRNQEGYEAKLVTGKKAAPKVTGYRSNAELARDIADPRYQTDPAFRMDVEAKLAKSGNLL